MLLLQFPRQNNLVIFFYKTLAKVNVEFFKKNTNNLARKS